MDLSRVSARFVPSSISYMEKQPKAQDQVTPSQIKQRESETNDITDRNQEARFGFTNIGGTGSVSIAEIRDASFRI